MPKTESRPTPSILTAIGEVTEDFYGGTAYLGEGLTWKLLARKADQMLAVEERIDGEGVSKNLRNVVFSAKTLDLMALTKADLRTRPFTNQKLTPIPELSDFFKRIQATTLSIAEQQSVKDFAYRIVRSGGIVAPKNYERVRVKTGTHQTWRQILEQEAVADPALEFFQRNPEVCDPYWQFHNVAMSLPGGSDDFPRHLWDDSEKREPVVLGAISDGPFKVSVQEQTDVFSQAVAVSTISSHPCTSSSRQRREPLEASWAG